MRLKHQGFTLIELMIVVAIIAILAAIALPAYQDYTIRSQVAEGQMISSGARLFIRDYYADRGAWPPDNAAIGISNTISGTYVSLVENINGVIRITYGNNASSKILGSTLGLGAVINVNGEIAWICGNRAITSGFTESVAGGAAGATTLIPKYLASSCR